MQKAVSLFGGIALSFALTGAVGAASLAMTECSVRAAGAPPLEVRLSSHKKMSRVFAAFAKRGWLTGKEDPRTKEFVVTSVRRTPWPI